MLRQLPQSTGRHLVNLVVCCLLLITALPLTAGISVDLGKSTQAEPPSANMAIEERPFGIVSGPSGYGMMIEPYGYGMMIEPYGYGVMVEPNGYGMVIEPDGMAIELSCEAAGCQRKNR